MSQNVEKEQLEYFTQTDHPPFWELPNPKKFRIGWKILKNSLPLILTFEAPMITGITNVYFLRQYNSETLIGGLEWSHIFLLSVSMSLHQSLNILVSTAFGSKDYSLCSTYLQRGLIILLAFYIPCFFVLFNFPVLNGSHRN